jgi:hypothetical protein
MAPVIDTLTPVPSTYATMSSTPTSSAATAFTRLVLGRSSNAIELLVPPAPPVHAATDLKARCFDFLADLLFEHSLLYSSAELIAAFGHIPGSSYNAALEATGGCSSVRSAFFLVDNLVALGFRDHLGAPITKSITADLTQRPTGISYFAFRSTVNPAAVDSRLSLPPHSFEFWLALPQTLLAPSSTAAVPGSVAKVLNFNTPTSTSGSTSPGVLITATAFKALSATEQAACGTSSSTDTLSDYAPDCLPLFSPIQLQYIVLRSAALPPAPSAISPRMTAVLASTSTSGSSYFGSLDFLDVQSAFDTTFPRPIPLLVTVLPSSVSIDSTSLLSELNKFIDDCKFHLFVPIFRSDYVGSSDRNDLASLHATIQALKKPSMSFRNPVSGHWTNLSPDELFAAYADLTPLLPNNVSLWGLNLVTQFFDALSLDLQEAIQIDPSYSPPDLSTLLTRASQLAALRLLRVTAVRHYTLLRSQERLIAKTVHRKLKTAPATALAAPLSVTSPSATMPVSSISSAPPDDVSALTRTFMSPAEQTMQRYQPAPNDSPAAFPIDPITNFQSCYPVGFSGCMFCGATDHIFRLCPHNTTPGASATFYKHLFAHKPHLRKRDPPSRDILPSPSSTPVTQSFPLSAPVGFPPPGLPPASPSVSVASLPPLGSPAPPPSSVVPKKARFFVQLVKSFSTHLPPSPLVLPPMPIAIDNGLPHITFDLGADPGLDPSLCGLMDTCGALNTGYLLFHLWLKSERPDLVADFVSFDDSNPFEPIKLGGAIRDPSDFDATDHGNLTAVIRYYTPYIDISGSPITISFALGSDVTVNTIFGLPMLCDLDAVISLRSNSMHSRALNIDFPITRAAANFGLPPDCSFDPAAASRHQASTCGLLSSPATSALALAPPVTALATATDDTSLGFLQRTVHPSVL